MKEDHFIDIYRQRAPAYQRMIEAEDTDANLRPVLKRLLMAPAHPVLDLGSGTGRMPQLLHRDVASGVALDLHRAMLLENRRQQHLENIQWPLVQADLHNLPFAGDCAGASIAGWAIGHFCSWYGTAWRAHVTRALREMERVTTPDGPMIILETLGTGVLEPAPPTPDLADYYRLLEEEWGFERQEVATDYQFASVDEAVRLTTFFFGESLAEEICRRGWARVPEWTGVWHRPASRRHFS